MYCRALQDLMKGLRQVPCDALVHSINISQEDYRHDLPQKRIVNRLRRKGVKVLPGQTIRYVMQQNNRPVLPEEYSGKPDTDYYRKLLVRSLFMILQPFGVKRGRIDELSGFERQTTLQDYSYHLKHVYIPMKKGYKSNKGLSERQIRRHLESRGWEVWRGGIINIVRRRRVYPNVRRKYDRLIGFLNKAHGDRVELLQHLCQIHHGMPDFICHRNGEFKFVECKFKYEQLSSRQIKCFEKLKDMGFNVEVYKFVGDPTKVRTANVNMLTGQKEVIARQMALMSY
jgi:hypothetical protein